MTYKFQLLVLKGMDIETEAFAKLTKKNPRHMERRELYHCFQKVQTESKSLGIISKSTLCYQKRKIWLKAKEPNLHRCFPKSRRAKRGQHNVHWRSKG
jgi:hypothetical protein